MKQDEMKAGLALIAAVEEEVKEVPYERAKRIMVSLQELFARF